MLKLNPLHKRFRIALGGGRSIQLSYTDIFNFWLISGLFGPPASRPAELGAANSCSLGQEVVNSPLPPRGCTRKCPVSRNPAGFEPGSVFRNKSGVYVLAALRRRTLYPAELRKHGRTC